MANTVLDDMIVIVVVMIISIMEIMMLEIKVVLANHLVLVIVVVDVVPVGFVQTGTKIADSYGNTVIQVVGVVHILSLIVESSS